MSTSDNEIQNTIDLDEKCYKTIYCMNLECRPERWDQTVKEVEKLGDGYSLVRFNAIENKSNPPLGHAQTFMSIVQMAKNDNMPAILIGEDDLVFYSKSRELWERAISDLPDDWDILSGGAYYIKQRSEVTSILSKAHDFCATHFILIRNTCYDKILSYEQNNLGLKHIDRFMGKLSTKGDINYYLIWPMISTQRAGYSDLRNRNVDDNRTNKQKGLLFLSD